MATPMTVRDALRALLRDTVVSTVEFLSEERGDYRPDLPELCVDDRIALAKTKELIADFMAEYVDSDEFTDSPEFMAITEALADMALATRLQLREIAEWFADRPAQWHDADELTCSIVADHINREVRDGKIGVHLVSYILHTNGLVLLEREEDYMRSQKIEPHHVAMRLRRLAEWFENTPLVSSQDAARGRPARRSTLLHAMAEELDALQPPLPDHLQKLVETASRGPVE